MIESEQDAMANRAPRESLLLMGQLSVEGADNVAVRIRNLSATGMMAETSEHLTVGANATVEMRNIGAVTGTIAWVRDGKFGMAFSFEIDPAEARKPVGSGKAASNVPDFLRPNRLLR